MKLPDNAAYGILLYEDKDGNFSSESSGNFSGEELYHMVGKALMNLQLRMIAQKVKEEMALDQVLEEAPEEGLPQ